MFSYSQSLHFLHCHYGLVAVCFPELEKKNVCDMKQDIVGKIYIGNCCFCLLSCCDTCG